MKLIAKAKRLTDTMNWASMSIGQKPDMPSSWMYVEAGSDEIGGVIRFYAADQTSKTSVKAPAEVTKPGKAFIHHNLVAGFLNTVPDDDDVTITLEGTKLRFSCTGGTVNIPTSEEGQDFKVLEKLPRKGDTIFEIASPVLLKLINKIQFATTVKKDRRLAQLRITGTSNGYHGEATDGNIAADAYVKDGNAKDDPRYVISIPTVGLEPLSKMLAVHKGEAVKIVSDDKNKASNCLYFRFSDTLFGTGQLTEKFPDLKPVFDAADKVKGDSFKVPYKDFKTAIERAILFSERGHIELRIEDNSVDLMSEGIIRGKFEAKVEGSDPEQKIKPTIVRLNLKYLEVILNDIHSTNLAIVTTTNNSRVWLHDTEDADNRVTYLLGCVR